MTTRKTEPTNQSLVNLARYDIRSDIFNLLTEYRHLPEGEQILICERQLGTKHWWVVNHD
jgi:hypothetical protein